MPVRFGGRAIPVHVCVKSILVSDLSEAEYDNDATRETAGLHIFLVTSPLHAPVDQVTAPPMKAPGQLARLSRDASLSTAIGPVSEDDFNAHVDAIKDQVVVQMTLDGFVTSWSPAATRLFAQDLTGVVSNQAVSLAQLIEAPSCAPKYRSSALDRCIKAAIEARHSPTTSANVLVRLPQATRLNLTFTLVSLDGHRLGIDVKIADKVAFVRNEHIRRKAAKGVDLITDGILPDGAGGRRAGLMASHVNSLRGEANASAGTASVTRHLLKYPRTTKGTTCSSLPVVHCDRPTCEAPMCMCRCSMPEMRSDQLVKVETVLPNGDVVPDDYNSDSVGGC